jgi:hypothetical protein
MRLKAEVVLAHVGRDRVVHRDAVIRAPARGLEARVVSASSGEEPLVCVTWAEPVPETSSSFVEKRPWLTCHQGAAMATRLSMQPKGPGAVAVSASGRKVAWTERKQWPTYPTLALLVADIRSSGLIHQRRAVSRKECSGECFEGRTVDTLTWAGEDALLLSMGCESDDGCDLRRLPVDAAHLAKGWDDGSSPIAPSRADTGYRYYDLAGSATTTSALVVERPGGTGDDNEAPYRAVQIDLPTGQLQRVVATAAKDRVVLSISGGPRGLVYTTARSFENPEADLRGYVLLPGEARGVMLRGVPAGTRDVVAIAA